MSGDPTANMLYGTLLKAAGKPYVSMLRMWVTTGKLLDPHEELLVKESKFIDRGIIEMDYTDEYWERRYTVRIFIWEALLLADVLSSLGMVRRLRLPNDIRLGCHRLVLWAGDYLEEHVCRRFWRAGSTRSCWRASTST
jgi:hypothetical protein